MGDSQQRPNSGQLFRNKKRTTDKQPNLTGEAVVEIDGKQYTLELPGWTKPTRSGDKYISLGLKVKGVRKPTPVLPADSHDLDHAFEAQPEDDDSRYWEIMIDDIWEFVAEMLRDRARKTPAEPTPEPASGSADEEATNQAASPDSQWRRG